MKSSLVILYHREPYDEVIENGKIHYRAKKSPNGIVPTLKSFFANVNKGTWVAWKQVTAKQKADFQERVEVEDEGNYTVRRIALNADQVKHFYHITSKEAFWPVLHSFPYHFTSETADWENFTTINRLFAEAACEEAADDALIWIHDYNLWLAARYIREMKPDARIAFFHHTPFPSVDVFNILPWRQEIVESLLCCDLVGFHIPRYSENFVNVARSLCEIKVVKREPVAPHLTKVGTALAEPEMVSQLEYKGQIVNIDAFPVGTNPGFIESVLEKPEGQSRLTAISKELGDRKLILAAGRVDYVKGNRQMLEAYERLLERRQDLHGKVQFLMTCVSAADGMRVYKTAQHQIEQLVGKINGRFARLDWMPTLLFTQPIPLSDLFSYYRLADVCWTTPLRDGLNLVAKEYVVAREDRGGVLVLSEFVGAAVELPQAVLTNPYSTQRMDEAIEFALAMDPEEQKRRMAEMRKTVVKYDVKYWADHVFERFESMTHQKAAVKTTVAV
ncbi:glucosylglycerol-phosphate synthase [Arthrospira platensis]|uniref:glucosylglycerol-phosphate synthase n=1 Tax=Limnospira TaxID=2596745 RepID=UPI0001C38C46|nr:glucosylglycerol-phosphate synthase [Arthrospira platensis]AMW30375.1 glucosylglycerol-phosphate synthase [Arthrospira platensis YZ]KDR55961.1 glucosylglycerol-phosphate synthase [Arthrospira platensis str. Paraca]MBD2668100.1 glucosylglycerol-phosphate synthase [Arthrospira platensis FACHB-439]MBD2709189.1 glucosylglycerol-phosphate synthase [Arthrospira platensis FACHB-835]MDT9309174.1 glucosylglycerol-phosphate synthase [Limnospira sp. Paracas R14]QQW28322.1 glucosylglycerol-phosphate s